MIQYKIFHDYITIIIYTFYTINYYINFQTINIAPNACSQYIFCGTMAYNILYNNVYFPRMLRYSAHCIQNTNITRGLQKQLSDQRRQQQMTVSKVVSPVALSRSHITEHLT